MKAIMMLGAVLTFTAIPRVQAATVYNCDVTSTHTEVDKNDRKQMDALNEMMAADSATLTMTKDGAELELFDKKGKAIALPVFEKPKTVNEKTIELTRYQSANNKKHGEVALTNDAVSIVDDSYGSHFAVFVKQKELDAEAKSLDARVWTAAIGEPDDDSGRQDLIQNSNVNLTCTLGK